MSFSTQRDTATGIPRREHFIVSGAYFLMYGAVGLTTLLPLILEERGITKQQIGYLVGALAAAGALTQVGLGRLSDHLRRRKPFVVLSGLMMALVYVVFMYARSFWSFLPIYLLAGICFHAVHMALTATVADWASAVRSTASAFGQVRLWGSIGFIFSLGLLSKWLNSDMFILVSTGLFYVLMSALVLAAREPAQHIRAAPEVSGRVRQLLHDRHLVLFLVCLLLFKLAESASLAYFALRLNDLGGSRQLIAWALAVNAICEIPLMRMAGPLSERVGRRPVLLMAFLVLPLRTAAYAMLPSAVSVFPVQLFHGFTFSFMTVASVAFVDDRAPANLRATAQGLLGMAVAAGMSCGPFLGGIVAGKFGLATMYWMAAASAACGLVLFSLLVGESTRRSRLPARGFLSRVAAAPLIGGGK